jgi:hypothetical protein
MIDVAGYRILRRCRVLRDHGAGFAGSVAKQNAELRPGDVVLIGQGRCVLGETGNDEKGLIKEHDSASASMVRSG